MSQTEVISLTMTLTGASRIQDTNHFNYLCWCKIFLELKNHGKTQHVQRMTTKRSNLNTEKLLRWHGTIDEALEEYQRLNDYDPQFMELQWIIKMRDKRTTAVCHKQRLYPSP